MYHQKKPRNNEMNTTVFLLLFCILTAHCGYGGYQSELNRDFYRRFSGQQRSGYNYGQINPRANSQAFAKSGTYSNAASGCDYVARNGLTSKDEWSTSQAFSNVGGVGHLTQNTGQVFKNEFSGSQAKMFPLTSGQSNGGYGSGSYANQGQESVQKAKSFGNGFDTFPGLKYNAGQKVESHGNEFGSSQGNAKQGKSIDIESDQSQKSAYGFNHNSGNDYGSQLSKGSILGIGSSNGNMQSNYNRHDNTEHGQQYTYGRGGGGSEYQAGIQSQGLDAGHISGQSSESDGNSKGNTQYITGQGQKYTYGRGGLGSEYQPGIQLESLDAGHISGKSSESDGKSEGNTQYNTGHGQKYTYGRGGLGPEYQAEIQSQGLKAGHVSGKSLETGGNSNGNRQYITGHGQKYTYGREGDGSKYKAEIQSEGTKADRISGQSSESDGNGNSNSQSNNNRQDITLPGQKYTYGRGSGGLKYQTEIQSVGLKADRVSGQSSDTIGSLNNNANSNENQESLSSSSGASDHEDLQSTLSGALGLASQGLQASQNQPCSTCQKSSYAFSNAKSHSGSAVALSIAG